MTGPRSTRRRVLAAIAAGGSLSGCLGGDGDDPQTTADPGSTDDSTTTGTDAATTAADDLDLREANVTGVEVEASGDGYRFSTTLYHDDAGEDGYANWWQVEARDRTELGRRELRHAHGTQEFTRSATVEVPDDADCVVVRGHDETHGYGGQAMLVSLSDGSTEPVRQGPEPESFADAGCP